jgi:hypothetical protein
MTDAQPDQDRADPTDRHHHHAYYQLIHTLCAYLPPPLDDTPEALLIRNQAAVAKVAAMAPVNADEADIAAHCVGAREMANDVRRLIGVHADDIKLVMKLIAQYAHLERTAVSIRNQLSRVQAVRQQRGVSAAIENKDDWVRYRAALDMQRALDAGPPCATAACATAACASALSATAPAATAAPAILPCASAAAEIPKAEQAVPAVSIEATLPGCRPEASPVAPPSVHARLAGRPPAPPVRLNAIPSEPEPDAAPARRHSGRGVPEIEDPPRDLAAEADYYAIIYPYRAGPIRKYGGLPPDHDYGPPDDELVAAIVTGTSPALRALDEQVTGGT